MTERHHKLRILEKCPNCQEEDNFMEVMDSTRICNKCFHQWLFDFEGVLNDPVVGILGMGILGEKT